MDVSLVWLRWHTHWLGGVKRSEKDGMGHSRDHRTKCTKLLLDMT